MGEKHNGLCLKLPSAVLASAPEAEAAPEWQELYDDEGRKYLYNEATGESSWDNANDVKYNFDVLKNWDEDKVRDFFESGGGGEGAGGLSS